MNKRIRELAKEARLLTGWPIAEMDLNKFAELIVKETVQVVANTLPPNTYLDVADAVIDHFKE